MQTCHCGYHSSMKTIAIAIYIITCLHSNLQTIPIIVNYVLMSSLQYFIVVWVVSRKVLSHIMAPLEDYLWYEIETTIKERVGCDDAIMHKKVGEVGLTSP